MKVGIPREAFPGERRVAATPGSVQRLRRRGVEVLVEAGAGEAASFLDSAYAEAGATIAPTAAELYAASDVVLKVRAPALAEVDLLREGSTLLGFIWPAQNPELLTLLAKRKVTVLAMDCVPRITRAQKMDALSAMANVAGYKAVVMAAEHYGRFLGGQVTAAGRVKPAQVLVVGAGVAGLAAIAAARALGAVVKAFDTRPAVREQVESLGAQFLEFRFQESGEGEGGYAKEMSEAYLAAEQAMIAEHTEASDIIVSTALIPGKPAPRLITSGAVVSMSRGSVIVDLAAEQGGNCALTEQDKVVEKYGVTIIGLTDLTSRMGRLSSELYASCIASLFEEIVEPYGALRIDVDDEVQRGALVTFGGEVTWPPPRRAPELRAGQPRVEAKPRAAAGHGGHAVEPASPWIVRGGVAATGALIQHMTVFLLACIVGWHVVWNVTPALHTPLMSVTNAISGIIFVGGIVVAARKSLGIQVVLASLAVLLASINVAGGFLVTQRMLRMFRK
jgi:H+-translocating NAD(P) transhydrogenase subunit alpha